MIPFNRPFVSSKTLSNINQVLNSKHHQGDGPFSEKAISNLKQFYPIGEFRLLPSCTAALELVSIYLDLKEGDEVILTDYTFTSAAIAVTRARAKPIFVDILRDTKCIDVTQIEKRITKKTKAISWVNYAGETPDLTTLNNLRQQYGVKLIEDNAHSLGVPGTGITGDFVTQSFHATKNIQCGEGGSIKLTANVDLDKIDEIREKGTNRSKFNRGEIQKYEWVSEGSSFLLPEICAAALYSQLSDYDLIQSLRKEIFDIYSKELSCILEEHNLIWSKTIKHRNTSHMFFIDFLNENVANNFIEEMAKDGVQANKHYQSLRNSIYYSKSRLNDVDMDQSIKTASSLVRLPIYPDLIHEMDEVIKSVRRSLKLTLR